MKRLLSLCTLACLLLCLTGCHTAEQSGIPFYYCRDSAHYQYFQQDGVICGEKRDLASHRNDLDYALGLYLAGPMTEGLSSPFPKNTQVISIQYHDEALRLELSDLSRSLPDPEFTLACTCLTLTCMELLPCTQVTIVSADRSITLNADSLLLFDAPQEESTQ